MSDLIALQEGFQDHLLDNHKLAIEDAIVSTLSVSAKRRLEIYAYGYKARLLGALAISYPMLKSVLGDDEFETLGHSYIDAYPSPFRSIRWFGDKLDNFLQNHPHYKNQPALSELAKIEWIFDAVFDAQDADLLTVEKLGAIPPEDWMSLRFKPHPTMHRANLSWNVMQVWQAIKDNQEPPSFQLNDTPTAWLFWRKDLINKYCFLQESEAFALDAMMSDATFEEICEGLCDWVDEDAVGVHAAGLLKGWVLAGFIEDVR
jgi:hypothetical protein